MVRMALMGGLALLLSACSVILPSPEKQSVEKSWGGIYRVTWLKQEPAAAGASSKAQILQIRAITPEMNVPGAVLGQDGSEWAIFPLAEAGEPLPLTSWKAKDYEDITLLHPEGKQTKIECLESVAFLFICRTLPGTTVQFGDDAQDRVTATTGLFGVALHQGGFELTPMD